MENIDILLKWTAKKLTSQEWIFLSCLGSLVKAGLPVMENLFKPLAKNVLLPLG